MTPAMHAARKPVAQRVTEIAIGNKVALRIRKQYFATKGVLIDVKPDGIAIQTSRKGNRVETIPFGEIEHIRDLGNHHYATRIFARSALSPPCSAHCC